MSESIGPLITFWDGRGERPTHLSIKRVPLVSISRAFVVVSVHSMQPEILYEALHYLSREDLEACQLTSRTVDSTIRNSKTLALRKIKYMMLVSIATFYRNTFF